jgi:signal peptidase
MSPTFNEGSYIFVREKNAGEIKAGDIITFQAGTDSTVTHRVDEVLEPGALFATKGDFNNVCDIEPVSADKILGETIYWIEGLGAFLLSLNKPQNIIFSVLLLLVWFILPEIVIRRFE